MNQNDINQQFRQRLLFFIRKKIRYHSDAEDLCQDAIDVLLEALDHQKINNPDHWSAFVYGVAIRKIYDWYNQQKNNPVIDDDIMQYGESNMIDMDKSTLDRLIEDEQRQNLSKALHRLSLRERRILYLRYYRGWSYDDIGAFLHLRADTVRQIAGRARNKIAREFEIAL